MDVSTATPSPTSTPIQGISEIITEDVVWEAVATGFRVAFASILHPKVFPIVLAIVALGIFMAFLERKKNRKKTKPTTIIGAEMPYKLNACFLTAPEATFFRVLLPIASENNFYVFAKPRIADFVSVTLERYVKGSQWQTYFNKIAMKHIDFLLCDKDFKPVLGFEVDDSTHSRKDRVERDDFVDKIYSTIGLKVVHVSEMNDHDKIKQIIMASFPTAPMGE